ncbi:hypothetical protein MMC31_007079, partial [Peltigera leucophlebia]|nr:hypothetical protein [Peltigera leucophlebia]
MAMNLQILLCAASLSVFGLVNARPPVPAPPPPGECVVQEALKGRTYIGKCDSMVGSVNQVALSSPSCNAQAGEVCIVGQMPCSGEYQFFCGNENDGCFAAQHLEYYPTYTGEKLGQFQGICPQDLTCCHGCSGKECNFHPPISSPESLSPEGLQLFNTAFDLADSTIPKVPNADTNNFGMLNTGSADLLRRPNSQDNSVQNIDPNIGKTTSDFFKQAPAGINGNPNLDQKITLPVQEPAQQESPS